MARLARVERFETGGGGAEGRDHARPARAGPSACRSPSVIDVAAERERLAKAIDKLEKEAAGLRAKLANEAFLARAPEEVVDEQRARLEAAEAEIEVLRAAADRLAALA